MKMIMMEREEEVKGKGKRRGSYSDHIFEELKKVVKIMAMKMVVTRKVKTTDNLN